MTANALYKNCAGYSLKLSQIIHNLAGANELLLITVVYILNICVNQYFNTVVIRSLECISLGSLNVTG